MQQAATYFEIRDCLTTWITQLLLDYPYFTNKNFQDIIDFLACRVIKLIRFIAEMSNYNFLKNLTLILDSNLMAPLGKRNYLNNYTLIYNSYYKTIFYDPYSQNNFFLANYSNIKTPTLEEPTLPDKIATLSDKVRVYYLNSLNCHWWYLLRVESYLSMFDARELSIIESNYQLHSYVRLLDEMCNPDVDLEFRSRAEARNFPSQRIIWRYLRKIATIPELSNYGDITSNRVFVFIFHKF